MEKKYIIAIIVCSIVAFILGFAYGGYITIELISRKMAYIFNQDPETIAYYITKFKGTT